VTRNGKGYERYFNLPRPWHGSKNNRAARGQVENFVRRFLPLFFAFGHWKIVLSPFPSQLTIKELLNEYRGETGSLHNISTVF
jgi:hypothetical protein